MIYDSFIATPFLESDIFSLLFPPQAAGPKGNDDQKRLTVHYTASQHYQENVFIEGSRPQYLEDLHTEAQEGLKILQQEGTTLKGIIYKTTDVKDVIKSAALRLSSVVDLFRAEDKNGLNFADDESIIVSRQIAL